MGSIKRAAAACVFFLFMLSPLFGQVVSLAAELFRLETLASGTGVDAPSARDRHDAFLTLARLHQLSGNHQAALRAYEGALTLFPDDGQALLEQARFLISVGEHERAAAALAALLGRERERELLIRGHYLNAKLQAFRFGDTRYLSALALDADFAGYRSGIYYTLWRLTGYTAYKTRLTSEFPHSPEAGIISGSVNFAVSPLWLLFPGRDSIILGEAPVAMPPANPPALNPTGPAPSGRFLQAGLFCREANAQGLAEQIRRAGFEPSIVPRGERWAVGVYSGADVNGTIRRLREAGFESFPSP